MDACTASAPCRHSANWGAAAATLSLVATTQQVHELQKAGQQQQAMSMGLAASMHLM